VRCVKECVDEVTKAVTGKNPGPALEVLEGIPSEMDGVEDVEALRRLALGCVIEGIRACKFAALKLRAWRLVIATMEAQAKTAGGVEGRLWTLVGDMAAQSLLGEAKPEVERMVVRYLGPLHRLWGGGGHVVIILAVQDPLGEGKGELLHPLAPPIGTDTGVLTRGRWSGPAVGRHAAGSVDGGYVAGWCAGRSSGSSRHSNFDTLVKCLRLHHMSPAFLTSVVSRTAYREGCPYLTEALPNALTYQSIMATLSVPGVRNRDAYLAPVKPNRARRARFPYKLEAQVPLARCKALTDDALFSLFLGVAEGHGVRLRVRRHVQPGGLPTVGLDVMFHGALENPGDVKGGDTVGLVGAPVRILCKAGDTERGVTTLAETKLSSRAWVYPDFFGRPFGDVVQDGSPYFPEGLMTVSVAVHFISPQNAAEELPF
jgi:hypothetical protein